MQVFYNPVDTEHFTWTNDGWYEFDHEAAHKAAMQRRNKHAAELKKAGHNVRKLSSPRSLINRGGVGSGKPHIELVVTVYGLETID